jgi:dipeptidase
MRKRILTSLFIAALAVLVLLPLAQGAVAEGSPFGCTCLIAGRNTTADGSILFAKTEDDTPKDVDFLWYIPRRQHAPGSVVKLESGGAIPEVPETYAYVWDETPGTSYSNNIVNEWGVTFGSNACPSREDSVGAVAARGDLAEGGLGFELRFILAQRAKTAREAVLIAAKLLDTYGYNASGRCLHIVGPDEAWQLQMVRGKQYVARRVRDDEVAITANTYTIRDVDMKDRENFVCSPRLIDYAIERGWYDPSSGKPFDFADAYADRHARVDPRNTDRQWDLARLLDKKFPIGWREARTGVLPVSVKPDRKITLEDVMAITRDHYEGTALDSTDHYRISPHFGPERAICWNTTHRTTIVQQRNWLPPGIATLVWRALDPPCCSVYVPWYLGQTRIPEIFQNAAERADTTHKGLVEYHFHMPASTWDVGLDTASGIFKTLRNHVEDDYRGRIGTVRDTWGKFEAQEIAMQPAVEETFMTLYQRDKALASEFITLYSNALALKSIDEAKRLIEELSISAPGGTK